MPTTIAQVDQWRNSPSENQRLEFKEAKDQYDFAKLAQYCVAIANEGGGVILLGIADKAPRAVVGTRAFGNVIKTAGQLLEAIRFRVDIDEVLHPDGRVLVFHVPPRPLGTAYSIQGKYLMRSGESLVPMTEDRLRSIFSEGKPDWLEETSVEGADSQSVIDLLDTQTYFELLKQPYPTTREGVIDRLVHDRLVSEADGTFTIRRLGALLLARRLADFPDVQRKAARVVVYKGKSKTETRLDQTGTRGYAVGFQGLVGFVMAQLPQNEIIEGALRKSVKLVPDTTIRELVANALIHQDFTISGTSVMIEVFEDRVEISNPGTPLVPVERFIDANRSRNERLADIMRRLGVCEEKGSGIDRLVETAEFYQLPAPNFLSGFERTSVTIFGPRSFEEMDRNDRIRACYQHCALKRVVSDYMTNQSLRERFRLPEDKATVTSQVIAATIDAGFVRLDSSIGGSRKYARYLPFWA